ncbi:MAG: ImmA/IrrE family metallo-endopeptidase [Planctomycetes bacterium]|nr:ImmA/IrrE family metallo-endopeptidase [Planctomycetota bacterium]
MKRTKLDWQADERCQELAGLLADEITELRQLTAPIDPFAIIRQEHPLLRAGGGNFGDRFDGKLKYNKEKKKFLLFYNIKYDLGLEQGTNHPRTRFSICHELGHFFIDEHHKYLLSGGKAHASSGEFKTAMQMEREADAFASSMLLPTHLVEPLLNNGELTLRKLEKVSEDFGASLLCTTIRGVRLSDLPCAVAGIRRGRIAWMFPSKAMIEGHCYPGKRVLESPSAKDRWTAFEVGDSGRHTEDGILGHWFQLYDREDELYDVEVTQSFFPLRTVDTMVVLLTMDPDAISKEEDEEEDDIDRDHRERFGW